MWVLNNIAHFFRICGLSKCFMAFLFFNFLIFSVAEHAMAQNDEIVAYKGSQKQPNYDHPRIHFGFALAGNSARFILTPTGNFNSLDTVVSVTGVSASGFNLGIV